MAEIKSVGFFLALLRARIKTDHAKIKVVNKQFFSSTLNNLGKAVTSRREYLNQVLCEFFSVLF